MKARRTAYGCLAATILIFLASESPAADKTGVNRRPEERLKSQPSHATLSSDYGKLPLAFEPNLGQTDARVRFLARGGGMTTFFTDTETIMVLSRSRNTGKQAGANLKEVPAGGVDRTVVRMKLEKASQPLRITGQEKLPGISNYFIGNEPSQWRTDVPHYARIQYQGVYPGIDLVWYGNQRRLEYDFVVAPEADPKQIQVAYEGVESVTLDGHGELVLRTALGEVRQQKPRVYQEIGGKQVEVAARYTIVTRNRVSFALAGYDRKRELRIDPVVLVYSTFLAGSGEDRGQGIAVDSAGSAYVTGYTASTDFPVKSPYRAIYQGGPYDAFVTKLTPAGDALVYSTYLGGGGDDEAYAIAVDGDGSANITGQTSSADFPVMWPYQTSLLGTQNAFVTKLTPAGDGLIYSTFLGGTGSDAGLGIAVDGAGWAYVTGQTSSTNFPVQSPYQATLQGGRDAFATKLAPAGHALGYSTYLGGSSSEAGFGIAVDGTGSAYITGQTSSSDFPIRSAYQATWGGDWDAFVTKLTPQGNALVYSTYLGGSGWDEAWSIAVDSEGSAYVTGDTASTNFPTLSFYQGSLPGKEAAFVTKLRPDGNALVYSTYLGGPTYRTLGGVTRANGIAVDGAGSAYIVGWVSSTDFPTQSPYQATFQDGLHDAFVTKLIPAGNALAYSTYLGGSGDDFGQGIAVDGAGSAYVTGRTASTDFPTRSAYQATYEGEYYGAFVTKLSSLNITKTHAGDFFFQGQNGATYTVTVTNPALTGSTSGTVTVTETIPTGMTLVSMAGTDWTCPVNGATCSRSDPLPGGASYPPITVTVNVSRDVEAPLSNSVSVSGGGLTGGSAEDRTVIIERPPVLSVTKSHSGNFTQGQNGAKYTITISNAPDASPTSGTVYAIDSPDPGITVVSMAGTGWTCSGPQCTRNDQLIGGASYPPVTVTVNIDPNAGALLANFGIVSGGDSEFNFAEDDTVIINPNAPALSIAKRHTGSFRQGQAGATYSVTVSNATGAGPTTGAVTVTETVPPGMTLSSMAGTAWNCPALGTTCSRIDALNGGGSYPPITVAVNLAGTAASPLTNQATVSSGGSVRASANDSTFVSPFTCDINGDQTTNVVDVQRLINDALGSTGVLDDLDHDGVVTAADVLKGTGAALGLGCVY